MKIITSANKEVVNCFNSLDLNIDLLSISKYSLDLAQRCKYDAARKDRIHYSVVNDIAKKKLTNISLRLIVPHVVKI